MICIPHGAGITGEVFAKNKSVYFNKFEYSPYFTQETDNLKAFENIHNFIFIPMTGYDEVPNGVVQMYNFKQPITRLKVKKMIAMKKLIGSILDKVSVQNQNLEY